MQQWMRFWLLVSCLLAIIHHGRGSPALEGTESSAHDKPSPSNHLTPEDELVLDQTKGDENSYPEEESASVLDELLYWQKLHNSLNVSQPEDAKEDPELDSQLARPERDATASADEDAPIESLLRPPRSLLVVEICIPDWLPKGFLRLWISLFLFDLNISIQTLLQSQLLGAFALGRDSGGALGYADFLSQLSFALNGITTISGLANALVLLINTHVSLFLRVVLCITLVLRLPVRSVDVTGANELGIALQQPVSVLNNPSRERAAAGILAWQRSATRTEARLARGRKSAFLSSPQAMNGPLRKSQLTAQQEPYAESPVGQHGRNWRSAEGTSVTPSDADDDTAATDEDKS